MVYTSSCGAVYYGHPPQPTPFDESSWTDVTVGGMSAYVRSKALVERAAWDYLAAEGGDLELSVINPTGIFGPALGVDHTSSLALIKRLLAGSPPACPDLWFGVVDVRDVADLHLRAMTSPVAAGERFIATDGGAVQCSPSPGCYEDRLGERRPEGSYPSATGLGGPAGRTGHAETNDLIPLLGQRRNATSAKARRVLGWAPRPWEEAVIASGGEPAPLTGSEGLSASSRLRVMDYTHLGRAGCPCRGSASAR